MTTKRVHCGFRLPAPLVEAVDAYGRARGMTRTRALEDALRTVLEDRPAEAVEGGGRRWLRGGRPMRAGEPLELRSRGTWLPCRFDGTGCALLAVDTVTGGGTRELALPLSSDLLVR